MKPEIASLLSSMCPATPRRVALANAVDVHALRALSHAHSMGFITALLCGDENEIQDVARNNDIDISAFDIIHCVGNFAVGLLILPLSEVLKKLAKGRI